MSYRAGDSLGGLFRWLAGAEDGSYGVPSERAVPIADRQNEPHTACCGLYVRSGIYSPPLSGGTGTR